MDGLKAALGFFVTQVTQSVGVYTAVTGIFFYHVVFDKDFECTSEVQTSLCSSYMILPVFIIFVLLLLLDGSFQTLLKRTCLKRMRECCCFLVAWIFRAFLISLLWPMSVLIDGDWYACCYGEMKVDGREPTAHDQMRFKELKITSRIYGFGVLLGIVLMAAILRCVPWRKCCTRTSNWVDKNVLFHKIVLEECENFVTNELIEAAKGKIKEKLNDRVAAGEWLECYDVVDEIIDELSSSTVEATQKIDRDVDAKERQESSDVGKERLGQFPYYGSLSASPPNEVSTPL